ncbi:MAG: hypothetical protein GXO43_04340 [Crenarchaeota archaeon]|nr:hypothetical protein [Thermoproteota archaeon]
MSEKEKTAQEQQENVKTQKIDIKKLVSIVPPASELKRRQKLLREKRIRIKYDDGLPEGAAKIPKDLAKMLGISDGDKIEIVVAGKKKFVFTATIIDETGTNYVYVYPAELEEKGVADNSIATLRKYSGT